MGSTCIYIFGSYTCRHEMNKNKHICTSAMLKGHRIVVLKHVMVFILYWLKAMVRNIECIGLEKRMVVMICTDMSQLSYILAITL